MSDTIQQLFRCPACQQKITMVDGSNLLQCANLGCGNSYPIINGIPILINDKNSLFSIDDFVRQRDTFFRLRESGIKRAAKRIIPKISLNIKAKTNCEKFIKYLIEKSNKPKILVIGGSVIGQGMEVLLFNTSVELVEGDISFGPRTNVIFDAHNIPFEKESFDGVVVQAVLEHVVDPDKCVEEIFRVLKDGGVVYAETPFMQQVHGGPYDFMRYTYLGHRRLFRKFEEIDSGAMCGSGMALAWAYQYFLLSFTTSKKLRMIVKIFSNLTSFYLKYFDYYLIDRPGTLDAASGYYFMGKKGERILSDKELIKLYKGAI